MPDFGAQTQRGGSADSLHGVALASSSAVALSTSSATAHVKGAWTELVAATERDCHQITVILYNGGYWDQLVDVGIGAAGSEVVLLPNLFFSRTTGVSNLNAGYAFPVNLPAGTRIAVRNQASALANAAIYGNVLLSHGGFIPHAAGVVQALGPVPSLSGGTQVDPGATANAKGPWYQLAASTSADIRAVMLALGNRRLNSRTNVASWLIDVAIGAAGSEQVILSNYAAYTYSGNSSAPMPNVSPLLPLDIPAGSRVAARAQCSLTTTERPIEVVLYGVG